MPTEKQQAYVVGQLASVSGSAATLDGSSGNSIDVTATGNFTLTFTNLKAGRLYYLSFTQDGTGSRTLTYSPVPGVPTTATAAPTATAAAVTFMIFLALTDTTVRCLQKLA